MSLYPYRTYVPTWPTGYQREHAEAVYVGPRLRDQGPMSAPQLPPELDRLVNRDLGPPPLDEAAIASFRRMAGCLDEPRAERRPGRRPGYRVPGSLSERILDLLRDVSEPMTCNEIACALGASVVGTRGVTPKLVQMGDLQVRHIQRRNEYDDGWSRNFAQYLIARADWPPVPEGHRLYLRGAAA